jgi:CspA family cold shock protein
VRETGGTARHLDLEPHVPQGTVRWFDPERGFGFLAPEDGSADLFVHVSEVVEDGGTRLLREGQAVEYEVGEGDRGPQARSVRITGEAAAGAAVGVLGTVSWYEPAKGYGFATPDGGGAEIFVHSSAIVTGGVITAGQRVAFLVGEGERGPQAAHVVPLGPGAGAPAAADTADGADGTVAWYDEDKGFGFITHDGGGPDVFVHVKALAEGLTWLAEGDRVAYEVVEGDRGPQARDLELIRSAAPEDAPVKAAAPGRTNADSAPARPGEGVVARYDVERGFGFITPDAGGPDLFVHLSVLVDPEPLQKGERVRFAIRQSDRGPQADRVERV